MVAAQKGGGVRVWVKLSPSAVRFTKRRYTNVRPLPFLPCVLFSFFGFLKKATADPENVGLTLNAPKDVFWWQLVS